MKTNNETSGTTDKIEGNTKILSGKVKEETGKVLHRKNLEFKGDLEQNEGHVQKKVGEIKTALGV